MQELAIFNFYIKYYKGKKNSIDGLSYRLDYWDSSKTAEAKRALLASFLNKFISKKLE